MMGSSDVDEKDVQEQLDVQLLARPGKLSAASRSPSIIITHVRVSAADPLPPLSTGFPQLVRLSPRGTVIIGRWEICLCPLSCVLCVKTDD